MIFSTETQLRLVPAVYKLCSKYTKDITARLHSKRATNSHYVTVALKESAPWRVKCNYGRSL